MKKLIGMAAAVSVLLSAVPAAVYDASAVNADSSATEMEYLDRGAVALPQSSGIYISWRLLGTENYDTAFDVYRDGVKIATVNKSTNYEDALWGEEYTVVPAGADVSSGKPVKPWDSAYLKIDLDRPAGGTSLVGEEYTYSPNDITPADVDGDGEYELILKWEPSNSFDSGKEADYNGNVYIDCYKLDGKRLWRIDMGCNINAGAHFTPMAAYDFDLDGRAELALKTAPGTVDGEGNYVSDASLIDEIRSTDNTADYRHAGDGGDTGGRVLSGDEYYTVFQGDTGAALDTIYYPHPRGTVEEWGDNWGNRSERYLAAVAYLDGQKPSMIAWRGYYAKTTAAAYNLENKRLVRTADFDTSESGNWIYAGNGNHNLAVGDVDNDGCDEILCGSLALDNDLSVLWCSGRGHGDALHLADYDPTHEGMEYFSVHEDYDASHIITGSTTGNNGKNIDGGMTLYDAATGEELFHKGAAKDTGRGMMANTGSTDGYFELWGAGNYVSYGGYDVRSGSYFPSSTNQRIFWDGDMYDDLFDGISASDAGSNITIKNSGGTSKSVTNCLTINGTKNNACLIADLFGDWREEFVARGTDDDSLVIYTTTIETKNKLYTLMHDRAYRMQTACQNAGYNQPPHIGYYVDNANGGYDMRKYRAYVKTAHNGETAVRTANLPSEYVEPEETGIPTAAPSFSPAPTAEVQTMEPISVSDTMTLIEAPYEGRVYTANDSGYASVTIAGTMPTPTPSQEAQLSYGGDYSVTVTTGRVIKNAKLIVLDDTYNEKLTGIKIYDVDTDGVNDTTVDISDCGFETYDTMLWESLESMKPLAAVRYYHGSGAVVADVRIIVKNKETGKATLRSAIRGADGSFSSALKLEAGSYTLTLTGPASRYECDFTVE